MVIVGRASEIACAVVDALRRMVLRRRAIAALREYTAAASRPGTPGAAEEVEAARVRFNRLMDRLSSVDPDLPSLRL